MLLMIKVGDTKHSSLLGLTRDPLFYRDYMTDPLVNHEKLTAKMGVEIITAMKSLFNHPDVVNPKSLFCQIPLLIVQGTLDKVTSPEMTRAFYNLTKTFDKKMIEMKGLYHCIYNEPEKEEVLNHMSTWLMAHADMISALQANYIVKKNAKKVLPIQSRL